jgi:hypothetical protein
MIMWVIMSWLQKTFVQGDLSRELLFVSYGACQIMEDDKVKRVVRHDVSTVTFV